MIDLYVLVWVLFIIMIFGTIAYYISHKTGFPRVAIILIFGFILGITGILNRNWFYDFSNKGLGSDFPLDTLVQLILIIVLFYGGLSIDIKKLKGVLRPGILLATVGAFLTAFLIAIIIGFSFPSLFGAITALIIGSLLAPNDPIAVFSAQDSFKMNPKANTISKFESGLDDTMVTTLIILVCIPIALELEANPVADLTSTIFNAVGQFFWLTGSAVLIGVVMGFIFVQIYKRIKIKEVRMIANMILPFLTFTLASIHWPDPSIPISSGFVAVFVAGFVFGRKTLKNEQEYSMVSKIWAYGFGFCEIFTFIILGTLVRPEIFITVLIPSIVIVLSILFITRPLELLTCTCFTKLKRHEKLFIGYIGLKGLDPAVLAIAAFEALGGLSIALVAGIDLIINLTFTVILLITISQSIILTILFGKKGYYARKLKKNRRNYRKNTLYYY
jgi:cell volume regulation protein A